MRWEASKKCRGAHLAASVAVASTTKPAIIATTCGVPCLHKAGRRTQEADALPATQKRYLTLSDDLCSLSKAANSFASVKPYPRRVDTASLHHSGDLGMLAPTAHKASEDN